MTKKHDTPEPQPTRRVYSLTRRDRLWVYQYAEIPQDVFEKYVKREHGPDLFGMCTGQLEYDLQKMPEET